MADGIVRVRREGRPGPRATILDGCRSSVGLLYGLLTQPAPAKVKTGVMKELKRYSRQSLTSSAYYLQTYGNGVDLRRCPFAAVCPGGGGGLAGNFNSGHPAKLKLGQCNSDSCSAISEVCAGNK